MRDHPFKEFHDDAEIGNLIWRIKRRSSSMFCSQDGEQIMEMEEKIAADRTKLKALIGAYEQPNPQPQQL